MSEFRGFSIPDSNYFRMPNEWTRITAKITSLSEIKVIEYVLRHTWGFNEYGVTKRITTDEFQFGRLNKDGSRMDEGTGLTKKSIIAGLKSAVDHGYLVVELKGKDRARMRKYYALKVEDRCYTPDVKKVNQDEGRKYTPDVEKVYKNGIESIPTWCKKYTPIRERHLERQTKTRVGVLTNAHARTNGFISDKFCQEGAARLRAILLDNDADLVRPPHRVKLTTLAKNFVTLIADRRISKQRIKTVIKWLEHNYADQYTPKMHRVDDFATNFKRYEDAMDRHRARNGEQTSQEENHDDLVWKIQQIIADRNIPDPYPQKEIDELLVEIGAKPGSVTPADL